MQAVEQGDQVLFVLILVLAGNQDVIEINKEEIQILENRVHKPLKSLRCILQTKRHPEVFEQAKRGDYRRLGYILGVNWDLVITPDKVHLTKDGFSSQIRGKIVDSGYRVLVVSGLAIEPSEIATWAIAPPGLGHHVDR